MNDALLIVHSPVPAVFHPLPSVGRRATLSEAVRACLRYGSSELRTKGATSRHSDASDKCAAVCRQRSEPTPASDARLRCTHLPRSILRIVAVFLLSPSSDPTSLLSPLLPLPLLLSVCSLSLGAWSSSATVFLVVPPLWPEAQFSSFPSPEPYAHGWHVPSPISSDRWLNSARTDGQYERLLCRHTSLLVLDRTSTPELD